MVTDVAGIILGTAIQGPEGCRLYRLAVNGALMGSAVDTDIGHLPEPAQGLSVKLL